MKNKKIGIVTFHRAENYGAILQAYSLYSTLNLFEDVEMVRLIDYRSKELEKPYNLIYLGNDNRVIYNLLKSFVLFKKNIIKKYNFNKFRRKNMIMTRSVFNNNDYFNLLNEFDYVITGSDQVWNFDITLGDKDIYLINDNTSNKIYKRISYAASIGSDLKNEEYNKYISNAIEGFDSVSVREELAKKNLECFTDKKIKVCLDPVLLQDKSFWSNISKRNKIKEEYIFIYTTDINEKMIEFADRLAKEKNLMIVHLDKKCRYKSKAKSMYHCGPDVFLDLIANSKYVLTNSFHGLAFSIIFKKKFIIFPKDGRNSRIENLLKLCNLENRIYNDKINIDDEINYELAERNLNNKRNESIQFLIDSIEMVNINEKQ